MADRIRYYWNRMTRMLRVRKMNRALDCKIAASVGWDEKTVFEGKNQIWPHTVLTGSSVGRYTYVADSCRLPRVRIGRYCSLSDHIELILGNHPSSVFVSTYPIFYRGEDCFGKRYTPQNLFEEYTYADPEKNYFVSIGNDVWIGKGAKLKQGITIGDGAIIASYAVVVKDVPPYAVVGGVPARVIRYRFEPEEIEWLLKLQWWDEDEAWVDTHAEAFRDIKELRRAVDHAAKSTSVQKARKGES